MKPCYFDQNLYNKGPYLYYVMQGWGRRVRQLRYFMLRCKRGAGVFILKICYVTHEKKNLLLLLYFIRYQQQNLSSLKTYKFIN